VKSRASGDIMTRARGSGLPKKLLKIVFPHKRVDAKSAEARKVRKLLPKGDAFYLWRINTV